jgi:hypothetical protein
VKQRSQLNPHKQRGVASLGSARRRRALFHGSWNSSSPRINRLLLALHRRRKWPSTVSWPAPKIARQRRALPNQSCSAMLAPTQVLSMLKSTPIILPWLIRTKLLTKVGSGSLFGHTNIIRISAFDL